MTSDPPPTPPPPPFPPPPVPPPTPEPFSGPVPSGPPRHTIDDFFNRIRSIGLVRSSDSRWIAGVAGGIARRWEIDPILVRGGFVALTLLGGVGVVAYGLGWLLIPQEDGRIHGQQALRGDFSAGFIGAVLLIIAAVGTGGGAPVHEGFWFGGLPGGLIATLLVVAGIWWLARHRPRRGRGSGADTGPFGDRPTGTGTPFYAVPAPTVPEYDDRRRTAGPTARERSKPSRTIVRSTLGLALIAAAAVLIAGHYGTWSSPVGLIAAATALAVVAGGLIVSGLGGRRSAGLTVVGLLLAVGTLAGVGADHAGVRAGQNLAVVGSQEWRPTTAQAAGSQFNLGVGEATLSLVDPAIVSAASAANPLRVSARVGAGHLTVILPDDVPARVEVTMGAGEVVNPDGSTRQVNGSHTGSQVEDLRTGPNAKPTVIVQVQQGVGQLEIKTASGGAAVPAAGPAATPAPKATPTAAATT